MTAPDLRPSDDPSAAATMETGPEHQLAQLAKVLPAGGPLLPRRDFPEWECAGCGLRSTTPSLTMCLHGHSNCPMVVRT